MTPDELGVRHQYATVNGLRMHFVEKGEGPLVVLLHGFPEMWWSWRYQILALAEAGFRVVAPDLRGYNETEAQGPYDIDTLRDDVVGLLDHLGADKAIVVAHDWGGGVAWHLGSTRQSRCAKLVVMNAPYPVLFKKALAKPSQLKRSWYMFFFQLPLLPELLLKRDEGRGAIGMLRSLAVDKTNFGTDELRPMAEAVRKPGRASAMVGWYRAMMQQAARELLRRSPTFDRTYEKIRIPTLLLWALEDKALGYEDLVPGTERYVPDIEVQTIAGCGHFLQQEQPREVNRRLVEFLKRREAPREAGSPLRPS